MIGFSGIQLFEACLKESSSKGKDALFEFFGKMIKEEANELETELCDFEIVTSEDDGHQLFHSH